MVKMPKVDGCVIGGKGRHAPKKARLGEEGPEASRRVSGPRRAVDLSSGEVSGRHLQWFKTMEASEKGKAMMHVRNKLTHCSAPTGNLAGHLFAAGYSHRGRDGMRKDNSGASVYFGGLLEPRRTVSHNVHAASAAVCDVGGGSHCSRTDGAHRLVWLERGVCDPLG